MNAITYNLDLNVSFIVTGFITKGFHYQRKYKYMLYDNIMVSDT